jgi:hypothetical protein
MPVNSATPSWEQQSSSGHSQASRPTPPDLRRGIRIPFFSRTAADRRSQDIRINTAESRRQNEQPFGADHPLQHPGLDRARSGNLGDITEWRQQASRQAQNVPFASRPAGQGNSRGSAEFPRLGTSGPGLFSTNNETSLGTSAGKEIIEICPTQVHF